MSAKDALALGQLLVENLNLSDSNDTLGKWMAHHLAQLMQDAKKAPKGKSKSALEAQAAELIVKLWMHRAEFQNRINPLDALAPVIRVIQSLDDNNPSWIPRHLSGEASSLYHVFRRLMIAAICSRAETDAAEGLVQAKKTAKFQSADERAIVEGLGIWSEVLSPKRGPRIKIVYGDDAPPKIDQGKKSIEDMAREIIAEARLVLDKFELELTERAQRKASKPGTRKPKTASKKDASKKALKET